MKGQKLEMKNKKVFILALLILALVACQHKTKKEKASEAIPVKVNRWN